jgi:hypothetical protein
MADLTITDAVKQTVITRLATINSATSILSLINGRPAKVTKEEVLDLAEYIERWVWRGLLSERADTATPEKLGADKAASPADSAPPTSPAKTEPQPSPGKDDRPRPNGDGQRAGEASEKQINAIFAIGHSKGYDSDGVRGWVKKKRNKSVDELTSREASMLIDDLRAL